MPNNCISRGRPYRSPQEGNVWTEALKMRKRKRKTLKQMGKLGVLGEEMEMGIRLWKPNHDPKVLSSSWEGSSLGCGFRVLSSGFGESSGWGEGNHPHVRGVWRNNLGWRPWGLGELGGPLPSWSGQRCRRAGFQNNTVWKVWLVPNPVLSLDGWDPGLCTDLNPSSVASFNRRPDGSLSQGGAPLISNRNSERAVIRSRQPRGDPISPSLTMRRMWGAPCYSLAPLQLPEKAQGLGQG